MKNHFANHSFIYAILFLLFPLTLNSQSITLKCERNNRNGYDFFYEKNIPGTYVVTLKLTDARNSYCSEFKEQITGSGGKLTTIEPINPLEYANFSSYSYRTYRGALSPKNDSNFVYALPFNPAGSFAVQRMVNLNTKYFAAKQTKPFYAFEFKSKTQDTVCAVRKGIVIAVVDNYIADISIEKSYTSRVNSILIEHEDGSYSSFKGFKKGEIFVEEGNTVYPYTPLGKLSFYDAAKTYSLRLMIYTMNQQFDEPVAGARKLSDEDKNYNYINPPFVSKSGTKRLAGNSETLTALFDEKVQQKEMSRREKKNIKKIEAEMALKPKSVFKNIAPLVLYDSTYYDINENEVNSWAEANSYAIKPSFRKNLHALTVKEYFKSGQASAEYLYLDKADTVNAKRPFWLYIDKESNKTWLQHGLTRQWYPSGQLKREVNYRNGNISGRLVTYWENGQVKRSNVDSTGKLVETRCFDKTGKQVPVYPYAKGALFRKGSLSIKAYLDSAIVYPPKAIENGIEGSVMVNAGIQKDGKIGKIKTITSDDAVLEEELKRVVKGMPRWTIAFKDGENANSQTSIRYTFALPQHKIDWMKKMQKNDTTYYNKTGRIVTRSSSADCYEVLSADPNDNLKAIERRFLMSGQLKSERMFFKKQLLNTAYDSILLSTENKSLSTKEANELIRITEGKYSEWYENGQLSKEFYMKNSKRDGQLTMYWENGTLRRKEKYQEGKLLEGKCFTNEGVAVSYFDVDSPCSFPGGKSAMINYLNKNINYPINAIKNKKEGVVTVKFLVDKGGHITYTRTTASSVHAELISEARRVIATMPQWHPQFKDGDPVVSLQSIPVNFSLAKVQTNRVNTVEE